MDPWTMMINGDFMGAVIAPFTNLLGSWFYALMLFTIVGSVYLKTQNATLTAFVMLVSSISMAAILPAEVMDIIYIMIILVATVVMHKLFTKS